MAKTAVSDLATIDITTSQPVGRTAGTGQLFSDSIQLCVKCCRKLDAEGKALRKTVKAAIWDAYGEDVQLEKVDCFSLCPKGGQVLAAGESRQSRRLVIIQPGADVQMAVDYLVRNQG